VTIIAEMLAQLRPVSLRALMGEAISSSSVSLRVPRAERSVAQPKRRAKQSPPHQCHCEEGILSPSASLRINSASARRAQSKGPDEAICCSEEIASGKDQERPRNDTGILNSSSAAYRASPESYPSLRG
jgi:hypothetical protein